MTSQARVFPGSGEQAPYVKWWPWSAALAGAMLLYASFFPVDLGFLGWIALVPLLLLTRVRLWVGLGASWLMGLLFCVPALQWIRVASEPMLFAWLALAFCFSLQFPIFMGLARLLGRYRMPLYVSAPSIWTALEWVRARIDIGFPWYFLGHSQHDYLWLTQVADLFGVYGVSFVVVMGNVAIYELVATWSACAGEHKWRPKALWRLSLRQPSFVWALLVTIAAMTYGGIRIATGCWATGPRLALLQGNLPQDVRNDETALAKIRQHFFALADEACHMQPQPDLVIWSETSWVDPWVEIAVPRDIGQGSAGNDLTKSELARWQEETAILEKILARLAKRWPVPQLLGVQAYVLESRGPVSYNSAVLVDAMGKIRGRYDKMFRIPFGEYIPWAETLPILRRLSPYEGDYGIEPGATYTVFDLGSCRFSVLICYEDTVPHLAPRFLRQQPGPDFLVNISNDGWFRGTEEHEQHLATARFRAIECRRALVRAVNMGISCIIDGNGAVVALPGSSWTDSKARPAVVVGQVPLDKRRSLYVLWGDVLPVGCCLLIVTWLPITWWKPSRLRPTAA